MPSVQALSARWPPVVLNHFAVCLMSAKKIAPLGRNVSQEEVGNAALFFCYHLGQAVLLARFYLWMQALIPLPSVKKIMMMAGDGEQ